MSAQALPLEGEYWMHHGGAVRIEKCQTVENRGPICSIEYVQISNGNVMSGGGSSWWNADSFQKITDPLLLAATKAHAAQRDIREHQHKLATAEKDAAIWACVVKVMIESQRQK